MLKNQKLFMELVQERTKIREQEEEAARAARAEAKAEMEAMFRAKDDERKKEDEERKKRDEERKKRDEERKKELAFIEVKNSAEINSIHAKSSAEQTAIKKKLDLTQAVLEQETKSKDQAAMDDLTRPGRVQAKFAATQNNKQQSSPVYGQQQPQPQPRPQAQPQPRPQARPQSQPQSEPQPLPQDPRIRTNVNCPGYKTMWNLFFDLLESKPNNDPLVAKLYSRDDQRNFVHDLEKYFQEQVYEHRVKHSGFPECFKEQVIAPDGKHHYIRYYYSPEWFSVVKQFIDNFASGHEWA